MIKYAKSNYPGLDIIGSNVMTMSQAQNLIMAGVDGLRAGGIGSDSICTTQKVPVVGSEQAKAVYKVATVAKDYDILVIARGILYFGHIVKAFVLDTFSIMMDDFLDCSCVAPEIYQYQVAQGVVGVLADKSSVLNFISNTMQAVKQGLHYLGTSSLLMAHNLLRSELLRMEVTREKNNSCKQPHAVGLRLDDVVVFVGFFIFWFHLSSKCITKVERGIHDLVSYKKKAFFNGHFNKRFHGFPRDVSLIGSRKGST